MIILPTVQPNNDDELEETKRKLEIAVEALEKIVKGSTFNLWETANKALNKIKEGEWNEIS